MKNKSPQMKTWLALLLMLFSLSLFAQNGTISGKIYGANNTSLPGASVIIKGTTIGTVSNLDGDFTIDKVANGSHVLQVTFVGYDAQEVKVSVPQATGLSITLIENAVALDQYVVTGVFDKRTQMESSVAISVLKSAQLERLSPSNAADLLKNVPGVFVNSSVGEIRNNVYSRGVSTGQNNAGLGYTYVSMQEDGLPVTNINFDNFGPDYFLRADATLDKLEAVRGGTAAITGANAPGGIFNYISKSGGEKFEGEVRAKFGLEGNGKNPYYRTDLNFGGPITKDKKLTYNIGGFYRNSEGGHYPGYPVNYGGQVKGNLFYKYKNGSLKLYAKYLNDHNTSVESTPTVSFTDPKPAAGFDNTSSVLIPSLKQDISINNLGTTTYNTENLYHSQGNTVGLNWEQRLGEGWTITNNARYSYNYLNTNQTGLVNPLAMDNLVTYAIIGSLGIPGDYSVNLAGTGAQLMNIKSFSGFDFHVLSNTAPGGDVSANSLFFEPLLYYDDKVHEVMDQFNVSKKLKNMTFNIGGFLAHSKLDRVFGSAGIGLATIQNRPELVTLSVTDPGGHTFKVTNDQGIARLASDQGFSENYATQNQQAVYLAHTWDMTSKLTFDWGVRFESVTIAGHNNPAVLTQSTTGGLDGDPFTLYDNASSSAGDPLSYDETINYVSYSAALNYKLSDKMAVYGRYSNGKKAPNFDIYKDISSEFTQSQLKPEVQVVQQFEIGYKVRVSNLSASVTPFYSILSNVPQKQTFQNVDGTLYQPEVLYEKLRTYGVELEGNYIITKHFNVRGVATFQDSKAVDYNVWTTTAPGPDDDTKLSYSGNRTANIPNVMVNITPQYTTDKFFADLTWTYMGNREANFANAFQMPAFSQFNLGLGYNLTPKLKMSLNINNLFNTYGVMGWTAPGTFPTSLDLDSFTKEKLDANPDAVYSTVAIPARSYFLALSYKF
jgi:outer membrane receptor protein involved in Fe transport